MWLRRRAAWQSPIIGRGPALTVVLFAINLPRELVDLPDGSIGVRCPPEIANAPRETFSPSMVARLGDWRFDDAYAQSNADHSFTFATMDDLPEAYALKASLRFAPGTREAGFVVHTTPDFRQGFQIFITSDQMGYQPLPRTFWVPPSPVRSHSLELTQPVEIQIYVEGTLVEVFLGGEVAMVSRAYNRSGRSLGFYARDGRVEWLNIQLQRL